MSRGVNTLGLWVTRLGGGWWEWAAGVPVPHCHLCQPPHPPVPCLQHVTQIRSIWFPGVSSRKAPASKCSHVHSSPEMLRIYGTVMLMLPLSLCQAREGSLSLTVVSRRWSHSCTLRRRPSGSLPHILGWCLGDVGHTGRCPTVSVSVGVRVESPSQPVGQRDPQRAVRKSRPKHSWGIPWATKCPT